MKAKISFIIVSSILAAILSKTVLACIWDRDTLAMERQRFPSALELIIGKFVRHSEGFYRWRVKDRLKKLETSPNDLSLYDDLAVSYDKIGEHDKAIEIILKKETIKPGLYETYANLGTFYIHAGRYAEGMQYIDKAIQINPSAHFGREIYQRLLVEYLMNLKQDGSVNLPLAKLATGPFISGGFYNFLVKKKSETRTGNQPGNKALTRSEVKAAVKGILGMMKFGEYRSPVLLEVLADLLRSGGMDEDAKQLAVRAYLRASHEADDIESKRAYRILAWKVVSGIPMINEQIDERILKRYESRLQSEVSQAETWYARIRTDEAKWIAEGRDPEKEFERKYYGKITR